MISGVDRNGRSFASSAQVEIGALGVRALVANAEDGEAVTRITCNRIVSLGLKDTLALEKFVRGIEMYS
jgi:hypothetical protein